MKKKFITKGKYNTFEGKEQILEKKTIFTLSLLYY